MENEDLVSCGRDPDRGGTRLSGACKPPRSVVAMGVPYYEPPLGQLSPVETLGHGGRATGF